MQRTRDREQPVRGMILTENTSELQGDMKIGRLVMGEENWVWNVSRMRLGLQLGWKMLCGKEGRQISLTTPRRMQIRISCGKNGGQILGVTEDV